MMPPAERAQTVTSSMVAGDDKPEFGSTTNSALRRRPANMTICGDARSFTRRLVAQGFPYDAGHVVVRMTAPMEICPSELVTQDYQ